MSIKNTKERMMLDAYLDNELSAEEARQFEERLRTDPRLRRAVEEERTFRAALRAYVVKTQAPPELRTRMEALITSTLEAEATPPSSWWEKMRAWLESPPSVPRWALAVYTMLLILLIGSGVWATRTLISPQETHSVFRKLGGKHVVYTSPAPVVDIRGTPDEIADWFRTRVSWSVRVPDIPGWQVVGGRLGEYHHQPLVYLLYKRDGKYMALLLFTAREDDFPTNTRRNVDGKVVYIGTAWEHPLLLWREGDVGFALVGYSGQSVAELENIFRTLNR